jgi:hypothetical protein
MLMKKAAFGSGALLFLCLMVLPEVDKAKAVTPPSFPATCGSIDQGPQTCQFGFQASDVRLSKQLSNTACTEGATWSHTSRSVTVSGGCRAEFSVTMASERPHVIILTDIGQDPDDEQSLIRTLLYSNDISIRGIVPTYRPGKPVGTSIVQSILGAYGQDLPRLLEHDIRYTNTPILLGRVKDGLNYNNAIGAGRDSAGSNHIIAMVDSAPVPVWVLVWGGSRELAQALYKVKSTRSASAYAAFQKKLRVYTISWSQYSNEPGDWMAANAKDMFWIASASYERTGTATFRGMYQLGDQSMQKESWIRTYIKSRGNLGALYPLNTTEDGMKEGDSPSLLHVLPIGLGDPSVPKNGGWGGRYMKESAYYNNISKNIYTSQFAKDTLNGVTDRKLSVARWRPAYQSDFAARAEWLEQSYAEANHPPDARIVGANSRTVRSGDTVTLDAGPSSDPDGDSLSFKWWVYKEAGTYPGNLSITNNGSRLATLKVPVVNSSYRISIVLEVKDNGSPSSTRYQRVVLTLNP